MNGARYFPMIVAVSTLVACSDSGVTSNVPDMTGPSSDMATADMSAPEDMPAGAEDMGSAQADADMGSAPQDMREDQGGEPDLGPDEDMSAEPPVELPLERMLAFDYDEDRFRHTSARIEISPQPEGVIVLRVSWDTTTNDAPQRPITVRLCTDPPGDCVGQNPTLKVEGEVEVHTFAWEALPDQNYTLEFDAFASADVETVHADIELSHLPWQDTMADPVWAKQAAMITPPAALRGVLPGGSVSTNPGDYTTHWFAWDALAPGASSLRKISGGSFTSVLCDSDSTQAPWECAAESSTTRLEVSREGAQRFVLKNPYEQESDYKVVFLYEPFADALTCPPGEHPDGAGACIIEGACAAGYHDGGQGDCVPVGECDPGFKLDDQDACFGWFYAGNIPSFAEIETFWSSTNEIIELSDGKFFNTNNLDETDMLPDRSRPLIFDPVAVAWRASQNEEPSPSVYRSCALADGNVLAVGYGGPTNNTPKPERIYNVASDSWSDVTSTSGEVWPNSVMCALLDDGRTLVLGGGGKAKAYDAATQQWSDFPALPSEYRGRYITQLPDGTLVSAVESSLGNPNEVMVFLPNATQWQALANWPAANTPITDYSRFVACGQSAFCLWGSVGSTKYDVVTGQPVALSSPPFGAPGAFFEDVDGDYLALTTRGVAKYDADADAWTQVTPRPFGCLAMALEPVTGDILCAHNYISRFVR